jgi:hypothetical protein
MLSMTAGKVTKTPDGWTFPLAGVDVVELGIDGGFSIHLSDGVEIVITSPLRICQGDDVVIIDPIQQSYAALTVPLVHNTIVNIAAKLDGSLKIAFETGHTVEVASIKDHRPQWHIRFPSGPFYYSIPPAGLAWFPAEKPADVGEPQGFLGLPDSDD